VRKDDLLALPDRDHIADCMPLETAKTPGGTFAALPSGPGSLAMARAISFASLTFAEKRLMTLRYLKRLVMQVAAPLWARLPLAKGAA